MSKDTTAIATQAPGYLTLAKIDIIKMIEKELGGQKISFEKIKVPSGGATAFKLPGDTGKPEQVEEFSGVILHQHALHAYYKTPFNGGHNPPDCGSYNGITGVGDPGGSCEDCPLNQFDSGKNGGKACQNRKRLYILREGEFLPMLMSLPKSSIKACNQYIKMLLYKGRLTNGIVTRFSLTTATNKDGVEYSQVQFSVDRILKSEEIPLIEKLSEQIIKYCGDLPYDYDAPVTEAEPVTDPETGEVIEPLTGAAIV